MTNEQLDIVVTRMAGAIDAHAKTVLALTSRVEELERHVPRRIDVHDMQIAALGLDVHSIDVRTTQTHAMLIEVHTRLGPIQKNSNRTVELLELAHGQTVVVTKAGNE